MENYRTMEMFQIDDAYLNGYAQLVGWKGTLVYLSLCCHANKDQEEFPSIELMSEELAISRDSIMRGIKDLVDWNIIKIDERHRGESGAWKNNFYVLLDKSCWRSKPEPGHSQRLTSLRGLKSQRKWGWAGKIVWPLACFFKLLINK